jgi:hypothetical protein
MAHPQQRPNVSGRSEVPDYAGGFDRHNRVKCDRQHPTPILATTKVGADLDHIVASAGRNDSKWCKASIDDLEVIPQKPGVYYFVLPESDLPKDRVLILHGRTFGSKGKRRQLQIRFDYSAAILTENSDLVVYVGKAVNLRGRIKGHLSVDPKATTNQVLRGLVGKPHTAVNKAGLIDAKKHLVAHGTVYLFEHSHPDEAKDHATLDDVGESLVAERDLLELKLIARYAPPFNIKAER